MRFDIIYGETFKKEYVLAGKSDVDWTLENLDKHAENEEFTLLLNYPAPLLDLKYVANLARKCKQKGIKRVVFDLGELNLPNGSETVKFHSLETSVLNSSNKCIVERRLFEKIALSWLERGVSILSPDNVFIDATAKIGKDAVIYPFNVLKGHSVVGENTVLLGNNYISNSEIGDNSTVMSSYVLDSRIGSNSTVGPFSQIRLNSIIGNNVRVGDFVEIKNAILQDGVKSAHLTYVGDAEVGEKTNIGCGTVFCNYDGKTKHRTRVGKNVFVGANTNLIAPLSVGDNAFIAGGSTITEDVPDNTFAIARERQILKKKKI